ncbi:LysR family transcriptional regulator [Synechococcus sp. MVIR-18-1]|uniref:helix-turn-helix domain-containing protein n=1 Tax=Synechococcus sp. MVIR-18-1 TaxID=1386941 RepID=UPI001647DC4D|nr:LysR family transcriptional regulator [Synechococcus sp. MVIR-18-1]QNI75802.1 bacterial regulatory helix-turn-helix/ lysR family protein [Synechococcus sp. MVIR-18-1]
MPDPWLDFFVFDWVLLTGSTTSAADSLTLPQSTVSRRFRSFSSQHPVEVRRQGNAYSIISGADYVSQMRFLFARFRSLTSQFTWAIPGPFHSSIAPRFLPGFAISLDHESYPNYSKLLADRYLDIVYSPGFSDPSDGLPFLSSEQYSADSDTCLSLLKFRANLKSSFLDVL